MNTNPLSADVKAGGNSVARANGAAESGHDRVGVVPGEGRDLDREGQQFAHLLHRPSETTGSPMGDQAPEPPSGRRLESPFSIPWASLTQREEIGEASDQRSALPLTGEHQDKQATRLADHTARESATQSNPSTEARVTSSKEALPAEEFTDINSEPEQSSGDRILQNLFGQSLHPTAPSLLEQTSSPISSSDQIDRIDQLADRLAQRILVSDRAHTTDSEVRIQLRESVLQGAEISLRHDQGQLVVTFNVTHSDTAGLLLPQTDDLQRALANKLNESVRIEVNVSSESSSGQDKPSDGRSRNRRDLRDEWDRES